VNGREGGLPIEQFIQAITSQLDRAQDAMALKAHTGRPLTFAVKDLSLDLRAHVEMVGSVVRIVPAGPGEPEASTLHIALTTITRPMIEENTVQMEAEPGEPSLREVVKSEEEQRRLEWAGIHTVAQWRALQGRTGDEAIARVADIPALRLRQALEQADHPLVTDVSPQTPANGDGTNGTPLLRISGRNLLGEQTPQVRVGGEPVPVIRANRQELLVALQPHQSSGHLVVETAPGRVAQTKFDLGAFKQSFATPATIPQQGEIK
jgi:hypothetical protein